MLDQHITHTYTKNKLIARKLSTVEKRPTLYSLFFPSIYYTFILVVIGLGGLLCIIRIYNRPQREIRLSPELNKFLTEKISLNLSNEGYEFVRDTVLTNPERLVLSYKHAPATGSMLSFSVQMFEESSKSIVADNHLLFKLNADSADKTGDLILKRLENKLNGPN